MKRLFISVLMLAATATSFGSLVITYRESGGTLTMFAEGDLDLTDLSPVTTVVFGPGVPHPTPGVTPSSSQFFFGNVEDGLSYDAYLVSAPSSPFGTGGKQNPNGTAVGNDKVLGVFDYSSYLVLLISQDYVSLAPIETANDFGNQTIDSLGMTEGTYVWTLSNGQTITMNIGAVPEPSTYALGIGAAALGLCIYRKRRSKSRC